MWTDLPANDFATEPMGVQQQDGKHEQPYSLVHPEWPWGDGRGITFKDGSQDKSTEGR